MYYFIEIYDVGGWRIYLHELPIDDLPFALKLAERLAAVHAGEIFRVVNKDHAYQSASMQYIVQTTTTTNSSTTRDEVK